jgi:hypothetical protein
MTLKNFIAFTTSLMMPVMLLPFMAVASDIVPGDSAITHDRDRPLFSANELSLDLSGSYIAPERGIEHLFETSIKHDRGTWGGDVGVNYFMTRNIGIGVDANMSANGGNLVDAVLGDLTLRLPLGNSGFAPYVFGGGGRTTDRTWEWVGQAGLGLEYRISRNIGLFSDGRYIWPQHTSDALLLRAGLRFVF